MENRRQKMGEDFRSLMDGVKAEVEEFIDKAAEQAKVALEEVNADPAVKRAKRKTKATLARLGERLLTKFGTKAQQEAVAKAKRKRASKKTPTPPTAAPAS